MKDPAGRPPGRQGTGVKKRHRTPDRRFGKGAGPKPAQGRAVQNNLLHEALEHHRSGRLDRAGELYEEILRKNPADSGVLSMLGVLKCQQKDFINGIALMEKAVSLSPSTASYYCNLANALNELGRSAEALAACEKAVSLKADYAEAHFIRGICLKRLGRKQESVRSYREAIRHDPDMFRAYLNLGGLLRETGDLDGAVSCFRKALELNPAYAEAHNNLGNAYKSAGNTSLAIECFREAVRIRPDYADAYTNMAGAFKDRGDIEEAVRLDEKALELNPANSICRSNLLLTLHYTDLYGSEEVFRKHTEWFRMHAPPEPEIVRDHGNEGSPDRRLRIGYVSPDLKAHSVAFFFEPLLEAHDRDSFEVFCYSDVADPDETTSRIRAMSDVWRDTSEMEANEIAALIAGDGIDILVDLAGHTGRKQMRIFARKPAPVQVTWLGYPDTTGLATMDYRVTDAHADPPGLTEHLNVEKLFRMPGSFLCYCPPRTSPSAAQIPPVLSSGKVSFGSFNNRAKITKRVVETWAAILRAVPGSRLIIKANSLSDPESQACLLTAFRSEGVCEDRVELHGFVKSVSDHFNLYNCMDIALDTFPYNGTTTTCEALWMGVPVIALAGSSHVSRVCVSIMSNLGLQELLAGSREEYVQKAIALASDTGRLDRLRKGIRQMMERSALMDAGSFTRALEAGYREMWRTWCSERAYLKGVAGPSGELDRLKAAAVLSPGSAEAHQALCSAFRLEGRIDEAVSFYTDAVSSNTDSGELRFQLANLLKDTGRTGEALVWYARTLERLPDDVRVLNNMGNLLNACERLQEAIDCYSRAAALAPDNAYIRSNLGAALKNQGRVEEAIACQEEALGLKPDLATALSNLAACLNNVDHHDRSRVFEVHSRWARLQDSLHKAPPKPHDNDPDPERKIRIGYVSPDFRTHSVAYFIEPVLSSHSKSGFEVFCYANVESPDAMTERLGQLPDHWRYVSGMDEATVAGLIRRDRIDILVDLAGHTEKGSLPVFARKPAPVQATWLGYPNTTGLDAMDYRITDSLSDPPGDGDRFYSEKLVRLPGPFLCYRPSAEAPDIRTGEKTGPVTFASFNSISKIAPSVVRVWSG
ncbi:glycosyltransferase family 41 protein, partial [bacterium]|nr:glycosyltransferase family 41 protein [bacterium]